MKPYPMLLALLLTLDVVLIVAMTRPVPEAANGEPHAEYTSMSQGGTAARHQGRLVIGWIYGAVQIGLFVCCLGLGVGPTRPKRWLIAGCGALYLGIFSGLMLAYSKGIAGAPTVLGFPLPTTWLVFGMWPTAALFAVLYVVQFRQWIYSPEDARRFEEIRARYPGDDNRGS